MSSIKSQTKWVVKHFSSIVLILLVVAAGLTYFTSRLSVSNFTTLVFVIVVAVLALAYYGLMNIKSALVFGLIATISLVGVMLPKQPKIDSNLYQAVTLTTGQTFYGHLSDIDTPNAVLKNVYTLQAAQQSTTTGKAATTTKPILIKLSTVLPDPENQMTIKTDKILHWENLQNSGKVVQAIQKDTK